MSSAKAFVELKPEPLGRACHPLVERRERRIQQPRQREVFGVVCLRPAELVGDLPRHTSEIAMPTLLDHSGIEHVECQISCLTRGQLAHDGHVEGGSDLRPQKPWRNGVAALDETQTRWT